MSNFPNFISDDFESQYKFILKKSNEALILESKGQKAESYSLFISIIIDIDNLRIGSNSENVKITNNEIRAKINNLRSLRDNICECIKRIQQENVSNEDFSVADLIYSIQSECQYTKISKNHMFGVPCYPSSLEIYRFSPSSKKNRGFIMVGDWVGALIQDVTPILVTPEGALIFFDTDNEEDIKVAVTLPYNVSKDEFGRCLTVLSKLAVVVFDGEQIEEKLPLEPGNSAPKSTGEVIAHGLSKVSESVSKGVVAGATKLGELVCEGSNELCQHMSSGEASLNPNVKIGLEYARKGSDAMIKVSGVALGVLSRATQYLASKTAPHIVSAANSIIPSDWKVRGKNGEISTMEQVALVTGSGLQGMVLLFDSLHQGAVTFGRCAARSGSKVMGHRYGEEIGQSTENALYAAGNLGMVAMVAHQFTRKGILKTAATLTAIEVTHKYQEDNIQNKSQKHMDNQNSNKNNIKHI